MNSHLRHCPKHRKPLPCTHCALAAKPAQTAVAVLEPESVPVPVLTPAPKKRGRPAKHGIAMTQVERQTLSRANRKAKQDDAECRNLIVEILKIARRNLSAPGGAITAVREDDIRAANRKYLRTLHTGLLRLPVNELRLSLETLKTPDSHGRLHNERSGEGKREHGQSEIEKILGAKQHDSSYFEDEDQDPNMAAGFRVNPVGTAPESFETDETADNADASPGSAKEFNQTTEEKWRDRAINNLVHKMFLGSNSGTKCLFCDETFSSKIGAENHLTEQYVKGEKDLISFFDFSWALQQMRMSGSVPPGGFEDSKPRGLPYLHHVNIREEMELVKKQSRKKTGNFVT